MTTFYVGQRVRVIGCHREFNRFLIGKEGTVIGSRDTSEGFAYEVDVDGIGPYRKYDPSTKHAFGPEHLIPIQPPKSQIGEILAMKDLPDADCRRVAA